MSFSASKYFVATLEYLPPLLVIASSFLVGYLVFFSPFFAITHVICTQDLGESCQNQNIQVQLDQAKSANLFRYQSHTLSQTILAGDPTIRDLTINRRLPNTLVLHINSVYPIIGITTQENPEIALLDSAYRFIKTVRTNPNVPLVISDKPQSLQLGQPIADPVLFDQLKLAMSIVTAIPEITQFRLVKTDLVATLPDGVQCLFTINRDKEPQINALRSLRQNATIPPATRQIDLRFNQVVLSEQISL